MSRYQTELDSMNQDLCAELDREDSVLRQVLEFKIQSLGLDVGPREHLRQEYIEKAKQWNTECLNAKNVDAAKITATQKQIAQLKVDRNHAYQFWRVVEFKIQRDYEDKIYNIFHKLLGKNSSLLANISENNRESFKKYLDDFKTILVREARLGSYLSYKRHNRNVLAAQYAYSVAQALEAFNDGSYDMKSLSQLVEKAPEREVGVFVRNAFIMGLVLIIVGVILTLMASLAAISLIGIGSASWIAAIAIFCRNPDSLRINPVKKEGQVFLGFFAKMFPLENKDNYRVMPPPRPLFTDVIGGGDPSAL